MNQLISKILYNYYENIYNIKFNLFFKFKNLIFFLKHQSIQNLFKISNTRYLKFWNKKKNVKFYNKILYNFKINSNLTFFKHSNFIKNNFIFFIVNNKITPLMHFLFWNNFKLNINFKKPSIYFLNIYKKTIGDGFIYIRGLFIIFFIDATVTDDEPLWEPIEWSLVQTWLLFIFIFAWIAENLITSRYGSYTGRDKRVWLSWYKSFWFIELSYLISYGLAALFVIVPFYYELTYSISFIFSWWNWYTRVFFFKFISIFTIIVLISHIMQLNIRWLNWKKLNLLILLVNFFIAYLLYTHFIMTFFGYFTDPLWYQKTRFIDYIQLSHEPLKWGWGTTKRDHFTYHKVTTVFWFKNDGPFAGAFLMIHIFFFFSIFFLYIYWITLLRRTFATKEVTFTFSIFCISALKQFYYFFFMLYILIFMSFIVCYWRFPIEFLWIINSNSWFIHFSAIIKDYVFLLLNILIF